jgi:polar amino acid transport system substrate-binding protein
MTGRSPHRLDRRVLAAGLLCLLSLWQPAALAAASPPIVMGMVDPETTYLGSWNQRIYGEAFGRLGLPMRMATYPVQRIGMQLDQGAIDGDVARTSIYGEAHPELIRVEESVIDIVWGLYSANASLELKRLEDLPAMKLRAVYRRGVLYCERALKSVLPAEQVFDVTQDEQGLMMLMKGRADVFCSNDIVDFAKLSRQNASELNGAAATRRVLVLDATPLYPYLLRKHAELAPRLAAVLKAMKDEGLIERYRLDALREAGR